MKGGAPLHVPTTTANCFDRMTWSRPAEVMNGAERAILEKYVCTNAAQTAQEGHRGGKASGTARMSQVAISRFSTRSRSRASQSLRCQLERFTGSSLVAGDGARALPKSREYLAGSISSVHTTRATPPRSPPRISKTGEAILLDVQKKSK